MSRAGDSAANLDGLRAAQARAIEWLVNQQKADGAFLLGDRTFEVWDTLLAIHALHHRPEHADVVARAWAFVRAHVREDGIAYHHRNRGTVLSCAETTPLMHIVHALAPSGAPLPADGFAGYLADNTDDHGQVRVGSDPRSVPDSFQTYPSVSGFALLFCHHVPAYRDPDHPVVRRVREALRSPALIQRPWQYFGTEYYALYYMAWGLSHAGLLDDSDMTPVIAYLARNQGGDGSIVNGIWTPTTTSTELHTALALCALALRPIAAGAEILARGMAYLASRQRPDGALHGGIFARKKQEDIYVTSLFIRLVDQYAAVLDAPPSDSSDDDRSEPGGEPADEVDSQPPQAGT